MKELNYLDITKTGQGHIKVPSATGIHPDMGVGTAQQIQTNIHESDSTPYVFRPTPFNSTRESGDIVGASVAWNQLINHASYSENGIDFTFNSTTGVVSFSGQASSTNARYNATYVSIPAGHKVMALVTGTGDYDKLQLRYYDGSYHTLNALNSVANLGANATIIQLRLASLTSGTSYSGTFSVVFCDLTAAFNPTIADYIYTLESGTAGAGIAKLREWGFFTKPYYAHNAGGIESVNVSKHIMTGLNAWDEEWEQGGYDANGQKATNNNALRSKTSFKAFPSTTYYVKNGGGTGRNMYVNFYDNGGTFISRTYVAGNGTFTTPANCSSITFYAWTGSGIGAYANDICINLSDPAVNGTYEPYTVHEYPLADITLRGVLKLDGSNNLYADGDTLESDGTHKTRYGIVELGALENWVYYSSAPGYFECVLPAAPYANGECKCSLYMWSSATSIAGMTDKTIRVAGTKVYVVDSAYTSAASFKTAMSGVYLVYPLATPTTETVTGFTNPQVCSPYGTEEFVDAGVAAGTRDVAIPCGHNTEYMKNIVGAIEGIPLPPTTNGNFKLRCTVASGVPTYSWVSE